MAYTFQNINTNQTCCCGDEDWVRYLDDARAAGWEAEGTIFDFAREVDDSYDDMNDYLFNLWMIIHVSREMFEWDGNYTEKKNQLISESDAYYLMLALEKGPVPPGREFLDFLNSGPIRILKD